MDDKDEDNYEPEDDLICVRLTEGVVKNIEKSENELTNNININNNNNNGLDFLEDNGNNDKNINNNKQEGNLDLLDLNSIFSPSSGNDNSQNDQNNNNQSPFDILNIPLNQNNNKDNNNPQSNTDISDILNMVIGTNNINNTVDINKQNKKAELNSMKECYKNEDISIYYIITKKETNNIEGSIYASNNKNIEINNIKISFLVQKFVKLTVLATSGDKLEPSQSLGIKKDFTLTSSEPNKKLIIKIKLHYKINDEEKKHEFNIKNL